MKKGASTLWVCLCIILTGVIIGTSFIFGAKAISKTIEEKEIQTMDARTAALLERSKAMQERTRGMVPPKAGEKTVKGVTAAGNAIKGDPNAKVLLVEFSDFKCPYSKRFYNSTFPQLQKEYIDTGKVKFTYRDFPLGSAAVAVAAECAGEQDKYWEMFDKLNTADSLTDESLKATAQEIGLDTASFNACLNDEEIKAEVSNDMKEGRKFGVGGTPAFFVNGRFISGARSFSTFKKIIDEELAK
ncbi:thioredoxin domain-containing protein [Candidatus Omnitrophota bacterium]